MPDTSKPIARWTNKEIMGVFYRHFILENGDELYLTRYGIPYFNFLTLENLSRKETRSRLPGTSCVFKVAVSDGRRTKDIVLKWNRMGEDIPGGTEHDELGFAEFNSPFEEFALLTELRSRVSGERGPFLTHKPLAIYMPAEEFSNWQLGRKESIMTSKHLSHKEEVLLQPTRSYAVVYEWIKGVDVNTAYTHGLLDHDCGEMLYHLTIDHLADKGFRILDHKTRHIIVRPDGNSGVKRDKEGVPLYACVDFELLVRTKGQERLHRRGKREAYLIKQARRFDRHGSLPSHLRGLRIMGVDYIYGKIESTGGTLFVVGHDPDLFDYFLPEKWRRTPRTKLSSKSETYHTITKDDINLVWKVSRVGEMPHGDPYIVEEREKSDFGYNSPFEEFSLCLELSDNNILTTYPRAIYRTRRNYTVNPHIEDARRYTSHSLLILPDGSPALSPEYSYIMIWGYWNGGDQMLAKNDSPYKGTISALRAYQKELIDRETYLQLMSRVKRKLSRAGIKDLNFRGSHILLTFGRDDSFLLDSKGMPLTRICNFDMLRHKNETGSVLR